MSDSGPSNDGATLGKRHRPCDACRRRKSRCVLEKGSALCVLCRFHGQECTYKEAPVPRKRTGPAGEPDHPQSLARRKKPSRTNTGTGDEEYDSLPGPSLLKRTLGLQNKHHCQYLGSNCPPERAFPGASRKSSDASNATDEDSDPVCLRYVHPNHAFCIVPDDRVPMSDEQEAVLDHIEEVALGHGPQIVRLYFRIVHPSFPVLHKGVFLEKYARSYREFAPPLLASVYLLAIGYWNFDEELVGKPKPDVKRLEDLAFSSFHETMRRPKLSSVQGGLLLTQYQTSSPGPVIGERYFQLTTYLVSLAWRLGLHVDCSNWRIPDWEIGLRHRIGWAIYMQDKWTALLEARPCLIHPDNWGVRQLSQTDFPENTEDDREGSSEVLRGRLVFMRMADLSLVMSYCHASVFSMQSRMDIENAVDKLAAIVKLTKPAQAALWDWSLSQPNLLKLERTSSTKLSSIGYLHFAYITVEICMHRQIFRAMMMGENLDPALAQSCRAAGRKWFFDATDFMSRLQAHHLKSFWYATSAYSCAQVYSLGMMLGQAATTDAERLEYNQKLKEFKWALKLNSEAGAGFAKKGLALINYMVGITLQSSLDIPEFSDTPESAGSSLIVPSSATSVAYSEPPQTFNDYHAQQWAINTNLSGAWTGERMLPLTTVYNPDLEPFEQPQAHLPPRLWPPGMP